MNGPSGPGSARRGPRIGLLDSGFGLISFADALLTRVPTAELLLALDPDHMPYGALTPDRLREVVCAQGRLLAERGAEAVVIACNTASVHALGALRELLEPDIPVIGTVPAIKQAAAAGEPFAVWATTATTGSDYQRLLIDRFASGCAVSPVACAGLADAVESADPQAVAEAVSQAAAATPAEVGSVVLGCTHYGLVADEIRAALRERTGREVALFDSPAAVAAQTLRRIGWEASAAAEGEPASAASAGESAGSGVIAVLLSGREGRMPEAAAAYPAGRRLLARTR